MDHDGPELILGVERRRAASLHPTVAGALRALLAPLAVVLLAGAAACGVERAPAAAGPLSDPAPSLEALARRVVEALAAGDTAALQRLRLTEREHNELVYPRLPAAKPPRRFPVDLAWTNIEVQNGTALSRLLGRYQGSDARYGGVACGDTQRFEGFEVHTECRVVLVSPHGDRVTRELFRHVLAWNGQHKIFRYHD